MEAVNFHSGISTIREFRALLDSSFGEQVFDSRIKDFITETIDDTFTALNGLTPSDGVLYDIDFVANGITVFRLTEVGFFDSDNWRLRSDQDKYNLLGFENIDVVAGLFDSLYHQAFSVSAECISEDDQCDGEIYRKYHVTFTYEES